MKKNLKYIMCIFFMFIIITLFNNSNVIEVETEVKGKLDCLSDYNIKLEKIEYANKSMATTTCEPTKKEGFWEDVVSGTSYTRGLTLDCTTSASVRGWTGNWNLTSVEYDLYVDNKQVCSGNLYSNPGYSSVRYYLNFNKSGKFNIKIRWKDNDGHSGANDFGPYDVDLTEPKLEKSEISISSDGKTIYYDFYYTDKQSGFRSDDNNTIYIGKKGSGTKTKKIVGKIPSTGELKFNGSFDTSFFGDYDPDAMYYVSAMGINDAVGNSLENSFYYEFKNNKLVSTTIPISEAHTNTTNPNTTEPTTNKKVVNTDEDDEALGGFGNVVSNSKLECDSGFAEIIDEAWNIILICAPILTILMGTIGFVQALLSSDADGIKKASSDLIKRAVALLLLMLLKVIVSVILNLFGITICF